nr:uncharacterized protein LOC124809287 isoform X1 [Hydra vulgaris]
MPCEDDPPPCKKNLTTNSSKDSGCNRQLIIAIAEDLFETYLNVQNVLSLIKPNPKDFVVSCDLKLANILCGLQSHSSPHPCTWCDVPSNNLAQSGNLRTFGSLKSSCQAFDAAGRDMKKAKEFGNVVHPPLLALDDEQLVLDLIPPMELHLLLGVVNHLFKILMSM